MTPSPMPKEISCQNFVGLISYIRKHYGEKGVHTLTSDLVDGGYFIQDKYAPERVIPIQLVHLTDPAYWVSNAFSLALLANVRRIVPGAHPLRTAGTGVIQESFSKTILFLARVVSLEVLIRQVARINARFNKTKQVRLSHLSKTSATFELCYEPGIRITRDVCDWNLGIYSGIAELAGVTDVRGREETCVLDGADCCRMVIDWKPRRLPRRLLRGTVDHVRRWFFKDLIAEYERTLEDRDRLIEQLATSETKYRTLFEDSLEAMSLSRRGRLLDVNPAWLLLHGYSEKSEVIGRDILDFLHPDDREILVDRRRQWPHNYQRIMAIRDKTKDGRTIHVEFYSSRIEYDGEESILATVRDITEIRKAEAERKQLEARIQRAEKMEAVATLAGGVAHDLNNILAGIVGYPDLILMQLPEDSPLAKPIRTMQETGRKASAIVQDLLTLARRGVALHESLNLNRVVSEYLNSPSYRKMRSYHPDVEIVTDLAPVLLNMNGSAVHLEKTVMNLMSNAAEAMPDGGTLTIRTRNRAIDRELKGFDHIPKGDYCVLTVADTGTGIDEEDKEKIFEPFYTKKKMGRSGTGLGMAVVWGTVKDHGGFIHLDSNIGTGTVIRLFFPATREGLSTAERIPDLGGAQGKGERILVVDDIAEQREMASEMLTALGYDVSAAGSGEEAVELIEHQPVDMVLLDMIMYPGIDGLETYRRLIAKRPGLKAVIASGYTETDMVRQAQRLGAGPFVKKPYTLEAIAWAVRTTLDSADVAAGPD